MTSKPQHSHEEEHEHPLIPLKTYWMVWIGLIIGTVITVGASYIDFGGSNNILIAMLIATAKAMLVTLYFMGLKYDGAEDNITFFGTFGFLLIFILLTGADVFFRHEPDALKVDASELIVSEEKVDMSLFYQPSQALIDKGKPLFAQQCATCHGASGLGDGPAAASLNPKPRNFADEAGWKNGRRVSEIFKTLTEGLGSMPKFETLPVEERFALIHYIRQTFMKEAPAEHSNEAISMLQQKYGGERKPFLPMDRALEKVAEEWEKGHH